MSDPELQMERGQHLKLLKAAKECSCNYCHLDIITESQFSWPHENKKICQGLTKTIPEELFS